MKDFISISRYILTFGFVGFYLIWSGLPWLSQIDIFRLFEYIINYGPRYLSLVIFVGLFISWPKPIKSYTRIVLVLPLYISISHLDYKITPSKPSILPMFTMISANIGEGGRTAQMNQLFEFYQPDFVFLQENISVSDVNGYADSIQSSCRGGLCLMSKYPFEEIKVFERKEYSAGYGVSAVLYKVLIPGGEMHFLNVHLQSVRSVFSALKQRQLATSQIHTVDTNRKAELSFIEILTLQYPDLIIVGDFNLTEEDSYYREFLGSYRNALSEKGNGFTYTFKTAYHGLRIDHILTKSQRFEFHSADTSIELGGDHLPLVVKLAEKK